MTTFAGLFEVVDGVEILRANVTQPDNMPSVKVKYTIMNIQLDRHNRVFVCRATNVNGNVSLPTTIQVFGELKLSFQNVFYFMHVVHGMSLSPVVITPCVCVSDLSVL